MNTGLLVLGLPLYELPPACAEVVGRLINMESDAQLAGESRPTASIPVRDVALSLHELTVLVDDGLLRVFSEGGQRVLSPTDLARRVLVHPVELGADGLPSIAAREAFVERFEGTMRQVRSRVCEERDQGLRRRARRGKGRR